MARNTHLIPAPPERVFEVLSDPASYGEWVVGSQEIRGADPNFPAAGSRFQHRVGFGPVTVADHTEVLEVDPPRHIRLRAKARPFGTAIVDLRLERRGDGTLVTMIEDPDDPVNRLAFKVNPLLHLLVRARNVESLRRLARLSAQPLRSAMV